MAAGICASGRPAKQERSLQVAILMGLRFQSARAVARQSNPWPTRARRPPFYASTFRLRCRDSNTLHTLAITLALFCEVVKVVKVVARFSTGWWLGQAILHRRIPRTTQRSGSMYASGTLHSWGRGRHGAHGHGHDNDVELPRRVSAAPPLHDVCEKAQPNAMNMATLCQSIDARDAFH